VNTQPGRERIGSAVSPASPADLTCPNMLPEAVRLLILKGDGSVLVHDDAGGYKPLNWMTGCSSGS
jgi:hypothetical protein